MYKLERVPAGYDIHPDGELKCSSLLKLMQSAAMMDTTGSGMGYEDLRSDGLAFVSYKTVLEVCGTLPSERPLTVKTWNRPKKSVKYVRDFLITDGEKTVARATTEWAMMNFEKRTLAKPAEIKRSMEEIDESVGLETFARISADAESFYGEYEEKTRYSELDINGHLNNTVYADICEDHSPFDPEVYKTKRIHIVYKREIKKDTIMDIKVFKNDLDYIVEVCDKDSSETLFQSQVFVEKK